MGWPKIGQCRQSVLNPNIPNLIGPCKRRLCQHQACFNRQKRRMPKRRNRSTSHYRPVGASALESGIKRQRGMPALILGHPRASHFIGTGEIDVRPGIIKTLRRF